MKSPSRSSLLGVMFLVSLACSDSMPTEPQGTPAWLEALIAQIEAEPVTVPPTAIYSSTRSEERLVFQDPRT